VVALKKTGRHTYTLTYHPRSTSLVTKNSCAHSIGISTRHIRGSKASPGLPHRTLAAATRRRRLSRLRTPPVLSPVAANRKILAASSSRTLCTELGRRGSAPSPPSPPARATPPAGQASPPRAPLYPEHAVQAASSLSPGELLSTDVSH
jgi:hypothetical protein